MGRDGEKFSDKWSNGLQTLHGFSTHGFPNCFFLGFTQAAVTVNVPHAPSGFFTSGYGGGPIKFSRILDQCRDSGDFEGIEFGALQDA